ncbi:MAG: HDOD domain-containing protein, partial [Pseudomonadota bacterium]
MDPAIAMGFLNMLARELESGKIELPSFPDAVVKIRDAIQRDDCEVSQVVKLLNLEPMLASRLMQMACSVFYNPTGRPVESLNAAVVRLGLNEVRNKAVAFAVEQLFVSKEHAKIAKGLSLLWRISVTTAATASVISKAWGPVDPEQAYLAGLVHDIGKLYMLKKSDQFPEAVIDLKARCDDDASWHPQIGRSICEGWGFPIEILDSITAADDLRDNPKATPDLKDTMIV